MQRSFARPFLALAAAGAAAVLAATGIRTQPNPTTPLLPPANGPRRVEPGWHALVNATVHPDPGNVLERATVVIRDGVIVSVEAGASPPAGATVWDCTGLHVYAGLIDPYVEVETPKPDPGAPGAHWNPRVMPQRSALDAGRERGSPIDARTARTLREMGFTAAGVAPSDGIFRGSAAVVSLGDTGSDPSLPGVTIYKDRAFQVVAFDAGGGRRGRGGNAGPIENWPGYPNSQMGTIALIRQTLADADWLHAARKAIGGGDPQREAEARAMGFDSSPNALDHLAPGEDAPPLLFNTGDELEALRASKIAAEFERQAVIVGTGTEFRRLDAIRADARPLIIPLNFPEAPKVESVGEADEVSLKDLMTWEQAPANVRRLDNAYGSGNIAIALTTSKLPERGGGGRGKFMEHVRTAIRYGLSEERALAMLTVNPAVLLGVDDRLGTVEAGKVANLVVTDGPLFRKGTKVRDVWIDGRRHEVNPAPAAVEGRWSIALDPPIADAITMTIAAPRSGPTKVDITSAGKDGKDATVAARNVRIDHGAGRVSFILDHDAFGAPGVVTMAGLLEGDAIRGHGTMPNGSRFAWTAMKAPPPADAAEAQVGGRRGSGAGAEGEDEDEKPVSIPERRIYPLGAYGVDALPPQEPVVLVNATIWTCGPRGVIERGWISLRDGVIEGLGEGDPPAPRAGARVIDLSGRHITPGLIDCHSHTGISRGVNESGQAVTAEVRVQDVTDPDSPNWYRQLAGGVTTVNSLHGSANAIGGQNCVNKVRWGAPHPDMMHFEGAKPGIKFALGENVKQSNWGDSNTTRYPQTRMGVETLIRDRFTAAREYARGWEAYRKARTETLRRGSTAFPIMPRRDLELEALAEVLAGKRLVHCHSYRQDEILMLCRLAESFGFKIGTFQHNLEGYKVAEAVRENAVGASLFSDWWNYKVEVQDAIPYAGPIMHDVGVVVSYNSDSDELARRLNVEAAKAVKYSGGRITPEEALKFVTINPAIQLGIADRVGSLEPGKDADLAVWSGPPLSSFSRCVATYIDGREYFSLERDAALRRANAAERTRIIQKILAEGKKKGRGGRGADRGGEDRADADAAEAPPPSLLDEELRSGRRGMLIYDARRRADAARRELFLEMLRRGIDPETARCGDCGMLMIELEGH